MAGIANSSSSTARSPADSPSAPERVRAHELKLRQTMQQAKDLRRRAKKHRNTAAACRKSDREGEAQDECRGRGSPQKG